MYEMQKRDQNILQTFTACVSAEESKSYSFVTTQIMKHF